MDIRKFFGATVAEGVLVFKPGKLVPLGRSQIRSQRGRAPIPRVTRGRNGPVKPVTAKPTIEGPKLVHGLVRGGRKNPMGTFWTNKKDFVTCADSSGVNKFKGVSWRDYCPTASFLGHDGSGFKMRCGCDSGESVAATIIQKYARRMIVLNTVEFPVDPTHECQPCGVTDSSDEETESSDEETESDDEEVMMFRETYGLNDHQLRTLGVVLSGSH
jgi:hypothetical protein